MNRFDFYIKRDQYKNNIIEHSGYKPATTHDYVAVLPNFWGDGKHRYFYSQQEWDNYRKNAGYAQNAEKDKNKKITYNANKENIYNKNADAAKNAGADRAAKEKENAEESTYTKEKMKNKIKETADNRGNISTKDVNEYVNEIKEYKDYKKDFEQTMKKAIETGEWPDFDSFWDDTNSKIEKLAREYFLFNDCNAETNNEAESIMKTNLIIEWNNSVKEAQEIGKEKERHKNILKEEIIASDAGKKVIQMMKDYYNFSSNDQGGEFKFNTDDNDERWNVMLEEIKNTAKQIKANDTKDRYKDLTEQDIANIFIHNMSNLIHNKDKYGLYNRENEILKSKVSGTNNAKTNISVKEAISNDVKFLERDLQNMVNLSGSERDLYELPRAFGGNMSQGMRDSIADLDYRLTKIREEEIHDPETGLPIKAYNTTFEEDLALVNYHRQDDSVINTKWETSYNCSACTIAMCLRMQGYDVSANERGNDIMWTNSDRWRTFKDVTHSGEYNNKDEFMKMISEQPAGSYGDISVNWLTSSGHSMFYRITDKGKFEIWDAQLNVKVDVDSLLDRSKDWEITRLDNKEVNGYNARNSGWAKYN